MIQPRDVKRIRPEDVTYMKELAKSLNNTPNANTRMVMQQRFVRDMASVYGQERATKMLTKVWQLAKAKAVNDADEA